MLILTPTIFVPALNNEGRLAGHGSAILSQFPPGFFLRAFGGEASRDGLSLLELITEEPDFIKYFKDFLLQFS